MEIEHKNIVTHPYFVDKAREVFGAASGDPDLTASLAAWAQEARHRAPMPHGVIVGQDGTLLAETVHIADAGAAYVQEALLPAAEAWVGLEVGLAVASARRATGQPAIHLKASQLCYGPGKPRRS